MEIFNTAPLSLPCLPDKARVTLLALGDVGSTLLMGLRLLGGDVISSIGICDVRDNVAARWEFELDQIAPPETEPLPEVDIIAPEQLFDGDVFLFCASRMIPDTSVVQGDVRMAQYGLNRELVGHYARMAREKQYRGLFVVVSDPVDPLCRWALRESNKNQRGDYDGQGLSPEQIRGFGLGVMHARALYFARRDPRFASYLTEGRAFGPHGEDLVLANSLTHYDDALSRELTEKVAHANLEMRKLGFKPYVAPALSSGALTLLALLLLTPLLALLGTMAVNQRMAFFSDALGHSALAGLGLGNSRQKYLYVPEPQNDFIFSILCEELGFIGAALVVALFLLLLLRGMSIAVRARDKFGALLVVGFVVQVTLQAILNMAVVTNTIPNTGISLPFFSSGGTSLLMLLGEMGIVLSVSRQTDMV